MYVLVEAEVSFVWLYECNQEDVVSKELYSLALLFPSKAKYIAQCPRPLFLYATEFSVLYTLLCFTAEGFL